MRSQTDLHKDARKRSITEKKACNKKAKGLYSFIKRIADKYVKSETPVMDKI